MLIRIRLIQQLAVDVTNMLLKVAICRHEISHAVPEVGMENGPSIWPFSAELHVATALREVLSAPDEVT